MIPILAVVEEAQRQRKIQQANQSLAVQSMGQCGSPLPLRSPGINNPGIKEGTLTVQSRPMTRRPSGHSQLSFHAGLEIDTYKYMHLCKNKCSKINILSSSIYLG